MLCCSPASQELERLCSTYPGLITRSTVNVYDDWPTKALLKVALKQLSCCHLAQEQFVPKVMNGYSYVQCNINIGMLERS